MIAWGGDTEVQVGSASNSYCQVWNSRLSVSGISHKVEKLRLYSLRERHQELVALGFFIRNPFNQISKRCPGVAFYAEGNDK